MIREPKLWLTSMSNGGNINNIREMVGPIHQYLDGIIWVLHDCSLEDEGARYLEEHKGEGRIIHRFWAHGRHWVSMNDTLYAGVVEEGDYVIWSDDKERPRPEFVSRIKSEIGPLVMGGNNLDVLSYYGKAFLLRYRETMEYRGSPHWYLVGHNGRAVEWSQYEPDETKVRFNARPSQRTDPYHWVTHYLRYMVEYPAGTNHALLGLDTYGDPNVLFGPREAKRLEFRREMKRRGFPLTVEGFKAMCSAGGQPDAPLKAFLNGDKVWSDAFWYLVKGRTEGLVHSHKPSDALPIL